MTARKRPVAARWLGPLSPVLLAALLLRATASLAASPGVALVIGEGRYAGQAVLPACSQAAQAVSARLQRLGFTVDAAIDVPVATLRDTISNFADHVAEAPSGAALAYVCAEATAVDQRLFLLPSDLDLRQPIRPETQGVVVRALLNAMAETKGMLIIELGKPASVDTTPAAKALGGCAAGWAASRSNYRRQQTGGRGREAGGRARGAAGQRRDRSRPGLGPPGSHASGFAGKPGACFRASACAAPIRAAGAPGRGGCTAAPCAASGQAACATRRDGRAASPRTSERRTRAHPCAAAIIAPAAPACGPADSARKCKAAAARAATPAARARAGAEGSAAEADGTRRYRRRTDPAFADCSRPSRFLWRQAGRGGQRRHRAGDPCLPGLPRRPRKWCAVADGDRPPLEQLVANS